jgi:uncharacterized cupin superfamily protein
MTAGTVKHLRTIRFDPDAQGDPCASTTTREWYSNRAGNFKTGFWASEPGRAQIHYTKDELCVILDGKVRLTDASGHAETYAKGDTFLIPNGFKGVWETLEPVRKFYAIHSPAKSEG